MTVLFVIAVIIFFLSLDWAVCRFRKAETNKTADDVTRSRSLPPIRLPKGIFFAKSHTWLCLSPSGEIRLGVDDFVMRLLERPRITLLRRIGEQVEKGEPLLVLEEGNCLLTIRAPLCGEIINSNADLEKNPERMSTMLLSESWVCSMRPHGLEELRNMLLGEETRIWMIEELRKLRELITSQDHCVPEFVTLQSCEMPVKAGLNKWNSFKLRQFDELFLQAR